MKNENVIDVALDCDGVLCDFVGKTIEICAALGCTFMPAQVTSWDFATVPGFKDIEADYWREIKREGHVTDMRPLVFAREGVDALRAIPGVRIQVVTSPMPGAKTWTYERDEWLVKHFGFDSKDVQHVRRKDRFACEILVDDALKNVLGWAEWNRAKSAILWNAPYNQTTEDLPPNVVRNDDWLYVKSLAEVMVDAGSNRRLAVARGGV